MESGWVGPPSWTSDFFLKGGVSNYLFKSQSYSKTEREREEEDYLSSAGSPPKDHNGQAETRSYVFHTDFPHGLRPSCTAFSRPFTGSWVAAFPSMPQC